MLTLFFLCRPKSKKFNSSIDSIIVSSHGQEADLVCFGGSSKSTTSASGRLSFSMRRPKEHGTPTLVFLRGSLLVVAGLLAPLLSLGGEVVAGRLAEGGGNPGYWRHRHTSPHQEDSGQG